MSARKIQRQQKKIHIIIINTVTLIIKVRLLQAQYDSFKEEIKK